MAGRRRRTSNSTVGTVDDRHIRWSKESSLLRPAPKDAHSDDWPCFVLADAVIYDKAGRLANVLHADLEGPFVVRGYVDVQDKDLFPHLCRPTHRSGHIEIQKSWSYSIGYGPYPVVWASGEAGWFEINPAPQYQAIYDKMCQGITLYYMVMDVYETARDARKRKKRQSHGAIPLVDIFLQYAVAVGDGVVHDEVIDRCHDHAQFLIGHFPKETNFKWSGTTFYKWITSEYPDLRKRLADLPSGASALKPTSSLQAVLPSPQEDDRSAARLPGIPRKGSSPPARPSSSNLDVEMANTTPDSFETVEHEGEKLAQLPSQHLPPTESIRDEPRDQQTPASSSAMEVTSDDERPLLDILKSVLRDLAAEINPHNATPSQVPNRIFFMCRIKEYSKAKDIILYFRKDLAKDLPQEWQGTPFQAWLNVEASKPDEHREEQDPEHIRRQLQRRQKKPTAPPVRREAGALTRRAEVKGALANDNTVDAMEIDGGRQPYSAKRLLPPMVGRRSGKVAGLRLVSSSKKRAVDDLDDEESNDSRRGRKSVRASQSFDDDEGNFEDANDTSEVMTPFNEDEELNVPSPKEAVRIVIHAERVPTMSPSGPNGTWVCSEPDCGYVVRGAEAAESQEIIRSHFVDHEEQAKKINLAVTEGRRGHMPINHLLEKIQRMAKNTTPTDHTTDDDQVFPAPIKRRVLV